MNKATWLTATTMLAAVACSGGAPAGGEGGGGEGAGGTSSSSGQAGGSSSGNGGNASTSPSSTSSSSSSSSGGALLLEDGLRITRVTWFQAVGVDVVRSGQPTDALLRKAPVLAGRPSVVRVHVETLSGWSAHDVTAQVVLRHPDATESVLEVTRVPAPPSSDDDPDTLFQVTVPADALRAGDRAAVRLLSASGTMAALGAQHAAHVPRVGETFDLRPQPMFPLHLHLVPVRYDRDGSGRLPDTSEEQLERMRTSLRAMYPLADIQISVGEPLPWSRPLTLTLNMNFGALNDALYDRRQEDGAADGVYYFGLVAPADTYGAYCGNSCVTGQSYLVEDPLDADIRLGSGLGFPGQGSVETLMHELGHIHGRQHAPCGVNSWDDDYPYQDGAIGSWGWDVRDGTFKDPDVSTDFMGYCDDTWISDYTFAALHERSRVLSGTQPRRPARTTFRMLELGTTPRFTGTHVGSPGGERVKLACVSADGTMLGHVDAAPARTSHGPARLRVPACPEGTAWLQGTLDQPFRVAW